MTWFNIIDSTYFENCKFNNHAKQKMAHLLNILYAFVCVCIVRKCAHIHSKNDFVDIAIRQTIQGELVDSVEHHVESSTDYIKSGHLELKQAEMYQSKARKVFSIGCQYPASSAIAFSLSIKSNRNIFFSNL